MTPKELRNSILKLAVEGKLVRNSSEEDFNEQYVSLQFKKKAIIAKYKGKKRPTIFPVSDTLYDIPANWKWIRLGNIVEIFGRIGFRGYTKDDLVSPGNGAITLSPSNIDDKGLIHYDDATYISWEKYYESPEIMVNEGDIILCKTASVGKTTRVLNMPEKATVNPQLVVFKDVQCNPDYLFYLLMSPYSQKQIHEFTIGTSIPTFSQDKLANLLCAFPPLEEQKRIVEKIEELLPLVDRYEEAWRKLEKFNSNFPIDMEKSILHFAIHGKLSSHLESERANSFLKLLNKEECEVDFELPDNWICLKLEDCGRFVSGYTPKPNQLCSKGTIPYFKVADMNTNGNEKYLVNSSQFLLDENMRSFKSNTIVYPKNGGAVFTNKKRVLSRKSVVDLNTGGFEVCDLFDVEYFYLFFKNIDFKQYTKGTALPTLDMDRIKVIPTPIPPIEEQKRIVAKIEELLPLCRKLAK